jgi:HD-GYP domain-containing protein (c-di-GMP phosphodiesterase class II)
VPRYGSPLRRVAEVVGDLSEARLDELPEVACRAFGEVLAMDEVKLVSVAGELASWPSNTSHRRSMSRHSVQTGVSGATERPLQWRDGERTMLAVPVRRGGRRSAVFVARTFGGRRLTSAEVHAGELVAAAAAATFDHSHDRPDEPLALAGSRVEVGWAVVDALKKSLAFDACRVYLPGPGHNRVEPVVQCGIGQPSCTDSIAADGVALGLGAAGRAMVDGVSRLIPNARIEQHAAKIVEDVPVDESLIVVPVVVGAAPVAVILLARLGVAQFDLADLRVVERVAIRAATAWQTATLHQAASEHAEVSQALLDLGAVLGSQTSVEGVAGMLAKTADRLVACGAVSVWLRHGEEMHLEAAHGYTPAEIERLGGAPIPVTSAPFLGALENRDVTARSIEPANELTTRLDSAPPGSTFVVVAIGERAANRAAIVLQRARRLGTPSATERDMLMGIADQALVALTNRMLHAEQERAFMATVRALATALETKDQYTAEHASELEVLCTRVAVELGLQGQELTDVTLGAALHDVGKIGIPSAILNKPGPLTCDERDVMRRHPELGARIIEPVAALDGARELVMACHEHWDGSGYPLGIAGEQIPLGARIILACDAYHAMTSDRVYRAALSEREAVEELELHAGTQFDPGVADALLSVLCVS